MALAALPRIRREDNAVYKKTYAVLHKSFQKWWIVRGSNSRPSVCKTDALPTELTIR